jgi:predicted Zn-dependent protease
MEHRPYELAEEVYRAHPENPSYASTYAFSLYQQKKLKEALAVFEKMPTQMLELPGVAGYYGLCLAATGPDGKAKAAKYLDVSTRARMLPEEVQLFQRARQ